MGRVRRILHPTDFSRASARAFARALAMAKQDRAKLIVLHVMVPPSPFVTRDGMAARTFEELEAAARRTARDRLRKAIAKARKGGIHALASLVEGVPSDEIVRVARRRRADVIVIGTHGRTGLPRFLVGSVADRVLQLARCPVLTVRGR